VKPKLQGDEIAYDVKVLKGTVPPNARQIALFIDGRITVAKEALQDFMPVQLALKPAIAAAHNRIGSRSPLFAASMM
jgi:hypothetical protein